jgi:ribosomal protein S27AE
MKLCRTCNTEKDDSGFHRRKASPDGLAARCKKCQSKYDKARANLPRRVKAREAYKQTDRGKKAHVRACKKWVERNTVKRAANVIVGNAIRDGRLTKKPCEKCGETKVHGHHDDYAQPMTVRWLCAKHHQEWHDSNGEGANAT